jgi:hypothetical protein
VRTSVTGYNLITDLNAYIKVDLSDAYYIHSQALIVQDGTLASLSGFLDHTHIQRHKVGLLWTSDQPIAEASTYTGQRNM